VEQPGKGWVDLTVYHIDTRQTFGSSGRRRSFFSDGHAVSTSVFLTIAAGLAPGLDGWVQVPYQRLRFDDAGGDRLRSGVGDTRLYLRVAPLHFFGSDFPLAIRGGVKIPVGDFNVDSQVIPLGDGQTDWELMGELGHSFYPVPAYVSGWVGYRWREENDLTLQDFGDERFFLVQGGWTYEGVGLQLTVEGWDGNPPIIEGLRLPNAKRQMLQVTPSASFAAGPGQIRVGARSALAGRNLPAGTSLVVGYFTNWSF